MQLTDNIFVIYWNLFNDIIYHYYCCIWFVFLIWIVVILSPILLFRDLFLLVLSGPIKNFSIQKMLMSFKNFLAVALFGLMLMGGFLAYRKDTAICFVIFLVVWFLGELFMNQCFVHVFGRKKFVITRIKKSLKTGEIIEIGNEKHSFTAEQIKTEHKKKFFFYVGLGLECTRAMEMNNRYKADLDKFAKQAEIYYNGLYLLEALFYDLKTTRITTLRLEGCNLRVSDNQKYLTFKGNDGCSYHQDLFIVHQIHKTTNQRFQVFVTKEQRHEDYVSELDVFMKETGLAYIGESPVIDVVNESTVVNESPVNEKRNMCQPLYTGPVRSELTDSGYLGTIGVTNIYDEPK